MRGRVISREFVIRIRKCRTRMRLPLPVPEKKSTAAKKADERLPDSTRCDRERSLDRGGGSTHAQAAGVESPQFQLDHRANFRSDRATRAALVVGLLHNHRLDRDVRFVLSRLS